MIEKQVENEIVAQESTISPVETSVEGRAEPTPVRDAALGLALYSASVAWNSVNTAVRLTSGIAGFFFRPVKHVIDSAPLEPVRSQFDKLVARGEDEVDGWIQTGLSQEPRAREMAKQVVDPVVNGVVGYLSNNAAIQKLLQDQIDLLAKDSSELPQINILVRVLAENYIEYLKENPDQLKPLIENQGEIFIDHLEENPKQVQDLVQGQSVGMISEITDEVRERLVTGDSALEALARRLFRRKPRTELPLPPDEVQARAARASLPEDFPRLEAMGHDGT